MIETPRQGPMTSEKTNSQGSGWGLFLGGRWVHREAVIEVRNPFDRQLVDTVSMATAQDVEAAVAAARLSLESDFPTYARYEVLMRAADRVESHKDVYAWAIACEGSKTIREARREPIRTAMLLRLAAEEGRRLSGETLPFDSRVGSENRIGYYFRFPVGIVGAIAPFNDPLAVAAHKLAPAIAAGNAVVLKPASATPLSALRLARDLSDAGLPAGRLNVVTGRGESVGEALAADPRVRLLTFTGGVATGERITRIAGIKKLSMELGANSAVIVMPDADLERGIPAISAGSFAQAGQNCLGVQRIILHEQIYDRFADRFISEVSQLKSGSSMEESTDVCTMISESQALRLEGWIREAVDQGAGILIGGRREGALLHPTVLENVPREARLDWDEAYGPVVSLYRASSLDEAIQIANRGNYGLHAAIFTESLRDAFTAVSRLAVGAVIVNDSTDYRLDVMPFGGTKMSGIGREGIRSAIQEMTETRVVCLNL